MVSGTQNGIEVVAVGNYQDALEIHITPHSVSGLTFLVDVFSSLAEHRCQSVGLLECANVISRGLEAFNLELGPDDLSPFRMEHMKADSSSGLRLTWMESADTWLDCCDKVKVLLAPGCNGHQYLTDGYETVIVSFGEGKPIGA